MMALKVHINQLMFTLENTSIFYNDMIRSVVQFLDFFTRLFNNTATAMAVV